MFVRVDDRRIVKNRIHFDFRPDDQRAEVERLVKMGARHVDIGQGEQSFYIRIYSKLRVQVDVEHAGPDLFSKTEICEECIVALGLQRVGMPGRVHGKPDVAIPGGVPDVAAGFLADFARIPAGARSPLVRKPLKGIKAILNTVFERVAQGCGGEGRLVPDPDLLSSRFHNHKYRDQILWGPLIRTRI